MAGRILSYFYPRGCARTQPRFSLDGLMQQPHPEQIALTIQQPWAELILRGIKSIEIRSVPVGMRTTIYLYTSQKLSSIPAATAAIRKNNIPLEELSRGQIVGTVDIIDCQPCTREDAAAACVPWKLIKGQYSWKLANPRQFESPLQSPRIPYGMWFYPFRTKPAARNTSLRNRHPE